MDSPLVVSTRHSCWSLVNGWLRSLQNELLIKLWFAPESNYTLAKTSLTKNVPAITSEIILASSAVKTNALAFLVVLLFMAGASFGQFGLICLVSRQLKHSLLLGFFLQSSSLCPDILQKLQYMEHLPECFLLQYLQYGAEVEPTFLPRLKFPKWNSWVSLWARFLL